MSDGSGGRPRVSTGTSVIVALLSFAVAAVVLVVLLSSRGTPQPPIAQLDLKPTEQGRTYQDLLAIRSWLWKCVTQTSERDGKVPYDMLASFWVPGLYEKPPTRTAEDTKPEPTIHRSLTGFEDALVYLTKVVSAQRLELADEVERQSLVLRWITWGGIAVAFLTSLIVTVKSSEIVPKAGEWRRSLELAAIVLAACSATQVSVVGTLSPASRLAEAKVTLERMRQLHTQIAFDLVELNCAERGTDRDDAKNLMRGWQQRYRAITVGQPAASAPTAQPANPASAPPAPMANPAR